MARKHPKMRVGYKDKPGLVASHNTGVCLICGRTDKRLCFHHKDPKTRKFMIYEYMGKSYKALEKELKKCVTICVSCHPKIHAKMRKNELLTS